MKLARGTFGIFPAYAVKGKSAAYQSIYSWIWFHTNAEGVCFPSLKTLAKEAGVSKATVCRALTEMENDGILKRRRRKGGPKGNLSTLYEVIIETTPSRTTRQGVVTQGDTEPNPKEPKNIEDGLPTDWKYRFKLVWKARTGGSLLRNREFWDGIHDVVMQYGMDRTIGAFRAYASTAKYGPAYFVENAGRYMTSDEPAKTGVDPEAYK